MSQSESERGPECDRESKSESERTLFRVTSIMLNAHHARQGEKDWPTERYSEGVIGRTNHDNALREKLFHKLRHIAIAVVVQ